MPPCKKMYFHLFNAISDVLRKISEQDYAQAQSILQEALRWGEEQYIEAGEEPRA